MRTKLQTALRLLVVGGVCAVASSTAAPPAVGLPNQQPQEVAVVQARGADSRVDYASLLSYGPWDDRNYSLTQEDLDLLSESERERPMQIPVFFRVELRRRFPELRRTGLVQYPHSSYQKFRIHHGGYLVDGKIYTKVVRADGELRVLLESGVEEEEFRTEQQKYLNGEIRLTFPSGAVESAIAISPADPNIVAAGVNGPFGGQVMYYSTDGGESWNLSQPLPGGGTCCDPTVDFSSDGEFAYSATLPGGFFATGIYFYRSGDGGRTWDDLEDVTPGDPRREIGIGFADKEYIHVDKHPKSPFKDNIYATWHLGNEMKFGRSVDFGHTWGVQTISNGDSELGVGSDIVTDKSGNIYYFWPAYNSRLIKMRKSTTGGANFEQTTNVGATEGSFIFPIPVMNTRGVFIYVSADADLSEGPFADSIYAAWTDSTDATTGAPSENHARIQVAYSRDGGESWAISTPHETADEEYVDRWHHWLSVGPDGTVHIVYYDTRRDPSRQSVDLFYSFSVDGAATWSDPERVTSEISPEIDDGFEFGDYNGLDSVLNNIIAVYTDNRNEGGGGSESVDVYAVGVPTGAGGLSLSPPIPGEVDVDNTFTVTGGTPGGTIFYAFSDARGSGSMPICPGDLPLHDPQVLGSATADDRGVANLIQLIPSGASGRPGLFVAVDASTCEISNVISLVFP